MRQDKDMRKTTFGIQRYLTILGSLLVVIILGIAGCAVYIYAFNSQERIYNLSQQSEYLTMTIAPRGGESDQWFKETPGMDLQYGTIYNGTLTNNSLYAVSDWTLRVNIHEDCRINNAWCGLVEIHQHTAEGELVQTLDLRNLSSADLTLDYIQDGPDTLIPLTEGDYIIYHPSETDNELPIRGTPKNAEEASGVTIGLILYTFHEQPLVFDDLEITYYLQRNLTQAPAFRVFAVLSVLWLLLAIFLAAMIISTRAARKRIQQDELIIEQSISVLTKFVDAKDSYTNGHSYRVAEYSRLIAQKLGFSPEECRHLFYISLMHDCGKVAIPDAILKKPGSLTDEEYQSIKSHTTIGADLLKDFTSIEGIRDGALYHHERYDGNGYPSGKKGEDIPLIGRIICVADAFDAMNSQRCYRSRRSKDYILMELESNRGKQFDPKIVDCFLELIQEGKISVGTET